MEKHYLTGTWIFKLLAAFFAAALLFFLSAGRQIRYAQHDVEALPFDGTLGAVTDVRTVEQSFIYDGDYLHTVCVQIGTYARENTGLLHVAFKDAAGGVLWKSKYDIAQMEDNAWLVMEMGIRLPKDSESPKAGGRYRLEFWSEGCDEDNAVTLYTGTAEYEKETILTVGGEQAAAGRQLVMAVSGGRERAGARFYWLYVCLAAGGILLFYANQKKQEQAGRKCMLHTVGKTLDTYRFLVKQLVSRDFKTKYKRSVLGAFWSLLNPLLTMAVQYVVFSTIFRSSIENYPVYLLSASILFNYFTESVGGGLLSIVGNASLITKVYVPKYIYPATKVLSTAINLLISMIPLFVVILVTGEEITGAYVLIPYVVFCLILFCTGMALALSAFMVFFRDMQFLWGIISLLWMYATPMFYPQEIIPQRFHLVLDLNPMYHYIQFFRTILLGHESPQMAEYAVCFLFSAVFCAAGAALFCHFEKKFVLYL